MSDKQERLSVAHHQILQLDVHPTAGMFLEGYSGDDLAAKDDLYSIYQTINFRCDPSLSADHVSALFGALAVATASGVENGAQMLLTRHLLPWLPGLCLAIRDAPNRVYEELAFTALEICSTHAHALPQVGTRTDSTQMITSLEDGDGLRDLAEHLTSHARCGVYFGKSLLSTIARELELPTGFGSRRQTLLNIFRSAGQFDKSEALLERLNSVAEDWEAAYQGDTFSLAAKRSGFDWQARINATRSMFAEMRSRLSSTEI